MELQALQHGLLQACEQAACGDQEEAALLAGGLIADSCSSVEQLLGEDDPAGAAEAAEGIVTCILSVCSDHDAMQGLLGHSILQVLRPLAGLAAASDNTAGTLLPLLLNRVLHADSPERGPRPREAIMAVTETLASYSRGSPTAPQHLAWLLQQLPQLLQRVTRQQLPCSMECVAPSLTLLTEVAAHWQQQLQAAASLASSSGADISMAADIQSHARRFVGCDLLQPVVDILEYAWRLLQPSLADQSGGLHVLDHQKRNHDQTSKQTAGAAAAAGSSGGQKQLLLLGEACLRALTAAAPLCCVQVLSPQQVQGTGNIAGINTAGNARCQSSPAALQQLLQLCMAVLATVASTFEGVGARSAATQHVEPCAEGKATTMPTYHHHHQQQQQQRVQQQRCSGQPHAGAGLQGLDWQQLHTAATACALAAIAAQQGSSESGSDDGSENDNDGVSRTGSDIDSGEDAGMPLKGPAQEAAGQQALSKDMSKCVQAEQQDLLLQHPTAVAGRAGAAVLLWLQLLQHASHSQPASRKQPASHDQHAGSSTSESCSGVVVAATPNVATSNVATLSTPTAGEALPSIATSRLATADMATSGKTSSTLAMLGAAKTQPFSKAQPTGITARPAGITVPSDRLVAVCAAAGLTHSLQQCAHRSSSMLHMTVSMQLLDTTSCHASRLPERIMLLSHDGMERAAADLATATGLEASTGFASEQHSTSAATAAIDQQESKQQDSKQQDSKQRAVIQQASNQQYSMQQAVSQQDSNQQAVKQQDRSQQGNLHMDVTAGEVCHALQLATTMLQEHILQLQTQVASCYNVNALLASAPVKEHQWVTCRATWQQAIEAPLRTVAITIVHSTDDGLRSMAFRALNAALSGLPAAARAVVLISLLCEPSAPLVALLLQRLRKEASGGGRIFSAPWVLTVMLQQLVRAAAFSFSPPPDEEDAPARTEPAVQAVVDKTVGAGGTPPGHSSSEPQDRATITVKAVLEGVQLCNLLGRLNASDFAAACDVMASALSVLRLLLLQRRARAGAWPWEAHTRAQLQQGASQPQQGGSQPQQGASQPQQGADRRSSGPASAHDSAAVSEILAAIQRLILALQEQLLVELPELELRSKAAMAAGSVPHDGPAVPLGAVGPLPDHVLQYTSCCRLQEAISAITELL